MTGDPTGGAGGKAAMIEVSDLVFDYPGRRALKGLNFTIPAGTITALVGPNGAGKTTLMRAIAGLALPYAGRIRVDGIDVVADPRAAQRRLGFLQDFFGLYDDLTVQQCLAHHAAAQGVPLAQRMGRVIEVAEQLDLSDLLSRRARGLSRGQRQRLAIGQAIIHAPRLLLLDEPAAGLDPEARTALSDLLRHLRDGGITLLVSSHILAELEDYSTDMMILREGRILDHGPLRAFADHSDGRGRPMRLALLAADPRLAPALNAQDAVSELTIAGETAHFILSGGPSAQADLLAGLIAAGLPVAEFGPVPETMQDRYLARLADGTLREAAE